MRRTSSRGGAPSTRSRGNRRLRHLRRPRSRRICRTRSTRSRLHRGENRGEVAALHCVSLRLQWPAREEHTPKDHYIKFSAAHTEFRRTPQVSRKLRDVAFDSTLSRLSARDRCSFLDGFVSKPIINEKTKEEQ